MKSKNQALENRDYELHSLGWKSFQDLCSTIFADLWGQDFQIFSPTKDQGRDGYFQGTWKETPLVQLDGTFTVQCKFTSDANAKLTLALIKEEKKKAKELAAKGLADNYILIFNHSISSASHTEIQNEFKNIKGIKNVRVFSREWITKQITNSPKLRMLVPRIYGLGDLGYILDERAREQAQEILKSMEDDLAKFVKTKAYRDSARALSKKKMLILLGEAASGKSSIAAILSLVALDRWNAYPLYIKDPDKFEERWNPNDPNQVFWIDDAFGPTSYKKERVDEWNCLLKHMRAALKNGSRFIFTSRDYIFKEAVKNLKTSEFPLFEDAQVIIRLDELSTDEKKQILYNHVKLGDQSKKFKKEIGNFLEEIASNEKFLPEIARRIGNQAFTKGLSLDSGSIKSFVENPKEFLIQTMEKLDTNSRAAITLIFMSEGRLNSPIKLKRIESEALGKLGATESGVRNALEALEGSFTKKIFQDDAAFWTYKHPTIADAYSEILARSPELLDIYLLGTKPENLLGEIVCGDVKIKGAKVIVPKNLYSVVATKLNELPLLDKSYFAHSSLCSFLADRCSKSFLSFYLNQRPQIFDVLSKHGDREYTGFSSLASALHDHKILPDEIRDGIAARLIDRAIKNADAAFRNYKLGTLITAEELKQTLDRIKEETLPSIFSHLREHYDNYSPDDGAPEDYFDDLESFLRDVKDELEYSDEQDYSHFDSIDRAHKQIEKYKEKLSEKYAEPDYDDDRISTESKQSASLDDDTRSLFSDVGD